MNDQTDSQLLRTYAENHSEAAFAELVRRHVDFVYSAARRMVVDPHLSEDVTQAVFVAFAKNARQLTGRPVLSGWLHRTAQNIAGQTVRTIERRRAREQEAATMNELLAHETEAEWENIAPHLDTALGELSEPDRDALLLRYFERKSAREMAQTLGTSEEAAQKRVNRAVERLREFFSKRNVTIGAGGLAVLISTNAVQAAPVGLTTMLSTAVFANAATGGGTITFLKSMALTKLKVGVITSVVVASAATSLMIEHQSQARIRETREQLRQQAGQIAELEIVHGGLNLTSKPENRPVNNLDELEKLRGETIALRKEAEQAGALQKERNRLQGLLTKARQNVGNVDTNWQEVANSTELGERMGYVGELTLSMWAYARKHNGQFPSNFQQSAEFMRSESKTYTNISPAQFEIAFQGTTKAVEQYAHPRRIILVKERQPWRNIDGKQVIAWSSLQGGGSVYSPANGDFETWAKQHTVPPETPKK